MFNRSKNKRSARTQRFDAELLLRKLEPRRVLSVTTNIGSLGSSLNIELDAQGDQAVVEFDEVSNTISVSDQHANGLIDSLSVANLSRVQVFGNGESQQEVVFLGDLTLQGQGPFDGITIGSVERVSFLGDTTLAGQLSIGRGVDVSASGSLSLGGPLSINVQGDVDLSRAENVFRSEIDIDTSGKVTLANSGATQLGQIRANNFDLSTQSLRFTPDSRISAAGSVSLISVDSIRLPNQYSLKVQGNLDIKTEGELSFSPVQADGSVVRGDARLDASNADALLRQPESYEFIRGTTVVEQDGSLEGFVLRTTERIRLENPIIDLDLDSALNGEQLNRHASVSVRTVDEFNLRELEPPQTFEQVKLQFISSGNVQIETAFTRDIPDRIEPFRVSLDFGILNFASSPVDQIRLVHATAPNSRFPITIMDNLVHSIQDVLVTVQLEPINVLPDIVNPSPVQIGNVLLPVVPARVPNVRPAAPVEVVGYQSYDDVRPLVIVSRERVEYGPINSDQDWLDNEQYLEVISYDSDPASKETESSIDEIKEMIFNNQRQDTSKPPWPYGKYMIKVYFTDGTEEEIFFDKESEMLDEGLVDEVSFVEIVEFGVVDPDGEWKDEEQLRETISLDKELPRSQTDDLVREVKVMIDAGTRRQPNTPDWPSGEYQIRVQFTDGSQDVFRHERKPIQDDVQTDAKDEDLDKTSMKLDSLSPQLALGSLTALTVFNSRTNSVPSVLGKLAKQNGFFSRQRRQGRRKKTS